MMGNPYFRSVFSVFPVPMPNIPPRTVLVVMVLSLATTVLLPPAAVGQAAPPESGSITIARLKYDGGGDWYNGPQSLPNLLAFVRQNTLLDVALEEEVVEPGSDLLFSYPYIYMTGHGNVRFSSDEASTLRRYLEQGGFLHINDDYGLDPHVRREMAKVFPDREFVELPFSHPIYHMQYEFPNGLPKIHEHDDEAPQGFGILDDAGRVMIFYSYESDIGDGWDPPGVHNDPPEKRLQALQMGTNILVYAMTH